MDKTYSIKKMVGGITEFDERRLLTWEDFKMESATDKLKYSTEEKNVLKKWYTKGNQLQIFLNKTRKEFDELEDYYKFMYHYIYLQDKVIKAIKEYKQEVLDYLIEIKSKRLERISL